MAEAVYALCAATSILCAVLLLKGYRQTRTRLLFWASVAFEGMAINNVLLFADLIVFPHVDLGAWRTGTALAAISALLFGLIWESQ